MDEDTRYANPIRITGGPNDHNHVIGLPSGGAAAPLNVSVSNLARSLSTLRTRAAEIRAHTGFLPSESARRLDELRPAALQAVREHQRVLVNERQRIETLSTTASPIKGWDSLPGHVQVVDNMLLSKFMSMSISERTQVTAKCMSDPQANLRWTEALLRAPRELTDLPADMHDQLRGAALMALDPELAASIELQQQQVELGERAFDIAQQVLGETLTGALTELRNDPPEPATPPGPSREGLPDHVMQDLLHGGKLSRPSAFEGASQ